MTLTKLKRFADAEEAAKQAVKQSPDFGPAWALLGNLYLHEGRFADAADALQKASQLTPKDAEVWRSLAKSYAKLNDTAKSQVAIKKSEELTAASPIASASPVDTRLPEKTALESPNEEIQTFIQAFVRDMASNDATLQMRYYSSSRFLALKALVKTKLNQIWKICLKNPTGPPNEDDQHANDGVWDSFRWAVAHEPLRRTRNSRTRVRQPRRAVCKIL